MKIARDKHLVTAFFPKDSGTAGLVACELSEGELFNMQKEKIIVIIVTVGVIGLNEKFNNPFTFALLVAVVAYSCYKVITSRKKDR
jgi:hypothetical protein